VLGSLADLILDPAVKAAVKAEIESRIQTSQVTGSASALVMWEGLGDLTTDTGSGAKASAYLLRLGIFSSTNALQICQRRP
jgi:hypothetical protein